MFVSFIRCSRLQAVSGKPRLPTFPCKHQLSANPNVAVVVFNCLCAMHFVALREVSPRVTYYRRPLVLEQVHRFFISVFVGFVIEHNVGELAVHFTAGHVFGFWSPFGSHLDKFYSVWRR